MAVILDMKTRKRIFPKRRRYDHSALYEKLTKRTGARPKPSKVIRLGYRIRKLEWVMLGPGDPPEGWAGTWTSQEPYGVTPEKPGEPDEPDREEKKDNGGLVHEMRLNVFVFGNVS